MVKITRTGYIDTLACHGLLETHPSLAKADQISFHTPCELSCTGKALTWSKPPPTPTTTATFCILANGNIDKIERNFSKQIKILRPR